MMRKIDLRKIAFVLLLSVGCVLLASCKGSPVYEQRQIWDANGVWEVRYILNSKTECALGDFYSKYKKEHDYPPYIFVPSHITNLIDGRNVKVVKWGYSAGMWVHQYKGSNKIFLPYTIKDLTMASPKIYMLPAKSVDVITNGDYYVPNLYFKDYKQKFPSQGVHIANVVYDINYENEDYKYIYVDNYDYNSLIEIVPPEPERTGYVFCGWFKESECLNEWNFETDTLPELLLDERREVVFQETILYAKWNKK